jgi:tripartite-type tricarboxylate transporter receptor subunit TctC
MKAVQRMLIGAVISLAQAFAVAQVDWPAKPIRIIVPFPAGGQTDVAARVIGQAMGESLKTPVVIENKAGAHGFIGAGEAARSPADGYTLLVGSTGLLSINPALYERLPYNVNRDFAPVSLLITVPVVMMANTRALPVSDVRKLVDYAKAHPGKVNFASAGNGGSSHLVAEYFKYRTGVSMTHIPYKGEAPATADVVGGQVDLMFNTLVSTIPHLNSDRVRMLATATRTRLPEFPDVPTVAEALNLNGFEASSWAALYAPAGTAPEIVRRLSREVDAALNRPDVSRRLKDLGAVPAGGTPDALAAFQRAEQDKWSKVVKAAGIRPD